MGRCGLPICSFYALCAENIKMQIICAINILHWDITFCNTNLQTCIFTSINQNVYKCQNLLLSLQTSRIKTIFCIVVVCALLLLACHHVMKTQFCQQFRHLCFWLHPNPNQVMDCSFKQCETQSRNIYHIYRTFTCTDCRLGNHFRIT